MVRHSAGGRAGFWCCAGGFVLYSVLYEPSGWPAPEARGGTGGAASAHAHAPGPDITVLSASTAATHVLRASAYRLCPTG